MGVGAESYSVRFSLRSKYHYFLRKSIDLCLFIKIYTETNNIDLYLMLTQNEHALNVQQH